MSESKFIKVHLVHSLNHETRQRKLGGALGGHAAVEIDNEVYSFSFSNKPISLFPKKRKRNGQVLIQSKVEFFELHKDHDIKKYTFKACSKRIRQVQEFIRNEFENPSFNYAVFGTRCCRFNLLLLSKLGILKSTSLISVASLVPMIYITIFPFSCNTSRLLKDNQNSRDYDRQL